MIYKYLCFLPGNNSRRSWKANNSNFYFARGPGQAGAKTKVFLEVVRAAYAVSPSIRCRLMRAEQASAAQDWSPRSSPLRAEGPVTELHQVYHLSSSRFPCFCLLPSCALPPVEHPLQFLGVSINIYEGRNTLE